jgi:hypothetical protein
MENTRAYPGRELKGWTRSIALDKATNVVVVLDRVRCNVGAEIEARFHPGVDFDLAHNEVTLHPVARVSDVSARASQNPSVAQRQRNQPAGLAVQLNPNRAPRADLGMVTLVLQGAPKLIQGRQPDMPITLQESLSWIPYVSAVLKAPTADTVLATIFYPKTDPVAATAFKLSGDAEAAVVTFNAGNAQTSFTFAANHVTRLISSRANSR